MSLGKRQRPPMKRTTSMSEFGFDLSSGEGIVGGLAPPSDSQSSVESRRKSTEDVGRGGSGGGGDSRLDRSLICGGRRSVDLRATAHFLRACGLCKRRLVPGRDIYMYRGDTAYCSLECRQQQMNVDEKEEKFALLASSTAKSMESSPAAAGGGLKVPPAKAGTVATT